METKTNNSVPVPEPKESNKPPNENGTVHVDEFVRIHDPNTKQVYHEGRA
jgi:hypothetical protein